MRYVEAGFLCAMGCAAMAGGCLTLSGDKPDRDAADGDGDGDGDGDDTGDADDGVRSCDGVTCSGQGACALGEDGLARCSCNSGLVAEGLRCLVEPACPLCPLHASCARHGTTAACECDSGYKLFEGRCVSDGCTPEVFYAAPDAPAGRSCDSWESACTLQEAATAAGLVGVQTCPSEVWVAAGTYYVYRSSPTDTLTLGANTRILGGFKGIEHSREEREEWASATISGKKNSDSPEAERVYHVITVPAEATDTTLDGLSIRHGRADGPDYDSTQNAAVDARAPGLHVRNCEIAYNSTALGAAFSAFDPSDFEMVSTRVFANQASDAAVVIGGAYTRGWARLDGVTFVNNVGSAALSLASVNATVSRCTFVGNNGGLYGGAMRAAGGSVAISSCQFSGNRAESGAALWLNAQAEISRAVFVGNETSAGSVILAFETAVPFTNVTFLGNSAGNGGTLFDFLGDGSVSLQNSIVWNGDLPLYTADHAGQATFATSAVPGGSGTSIGTDPGLASPPSTAGMTLANVISRNGLTTSFAVAGGTLANDDLKGMYLRTANDPRAYAIASNWETGITLWTDDTWSGSGAFELIDPRLAAGSPCIDRADDAACLADPTGAGSTCGNSFCRDATPASGPGTAGICDLGALEYVSP